MAPFSDRILAELGERDLQWLVDNSIRESLHLEYKETLEIQLLNKDRRQNNRQEFLRDLTAMANAEGGLILFGISERRDANEKTGCPERIVGVEIEGPEHSFETLVEQLLRDGIDEPFPAGTECHLIKLASGRHVVAVRLLKSYRAPHMVTLGEL